MALNMNVKAPTASGIRRGTSSCVVAHSGASRAVAQRPMRAAPALSGAYISGAAPIKSAFGVRRASLQTVAAIPDGAKLDRKLRVAVIGGGPSGACAAETLAEGGVETFMFERKLDNCKVRDRGC